MKRHRSPSGGAAAPRPAGRGRPRGAVIGATAALFAAALLATACSSSAAAPSRLTVAQSDQDMLHYARCMRAHGVNVADPVHLPGHTGLSLVTSSTPPPSRAATAACNHFLGPVIQSKQAGVTPARLAALASYARCMRAHDINMLDPTSSGQLNLGTVPGISSNFSRESPQFRGADAACRHLLPAGVHDDGTGP